MPRGVSDGDKLVDITHADAATLRFFAHGESRWCFNNSDFCRGAPVADNVAFGLEVAGVVDVAQREKTVEQYLEMVNLHGWGGCKVHELSGGMQQRVGLARAFATESPILLMDEPFSALDPLIRVRLQDDLLDLQKRLRRTIVFVSHDLDEALKIGNRIVIMEGGRIVQTGEPEDIVLNPATDYVADFVAHMNPLKTLRAASVMRDSPPPPDENCARAEADAPLLEVLRTKRDNDGPVYVRQNGEWAGVIDERRHLRRAVAAAMTGADYVIVGAGSAGCALAYRLARAGCDVLMIEDGGGDGTFLNWKIHMPAALSYPMNMRGNLRLGLSDGGGIAK